MLAAAVLCAAPLVARAQAINFGALEDATNVVTLTSGAESGIVVGAGYAYIAHVAERPLVLRGDLTLGAAEIDVHDFRLRAGALAPIVCHGRWQVIGGLAAAVRGTHDEIARMIGLGTDFTLLAGDYAPGWFAAAEVGFDWALATHIEHSDAYRMLVYTDARDGWYGNPGGLLRYGVQGGVSLGGNDVILRAGQLRDVAGKLAMFPIYATLSYDRHW